MTYTMSSETLNPTQLNLYMGEATPPKPMHGLSARMLVLLVCSKAPYKHSLPMSLHACIPHGVKSFQNEVNLVVRSK